MDLNLKGRVAFVTGASHGIGRAIDTALAAEGVSIGCAVNVDDEHRRGI